MSIKFIGDVPHDALDAFERILTPVLRHSSAKHEIVVAPGTNTIDDAAVRDALASGKTFAIVGARKGQLADVDPGTGIDVPQDLALFAVKRVPITGQHGKFHTIVTMVADPKTLHIEAAATDQNGEVTKASQPMFRMLSETIAEALKGHILFQSVLDSNLIPPAGANYGVATYNFNWNATPTQNFWQEASGTTQTCAAHTSQTYYVYFANGNGQAPQYVVLLVQNGTASPATSGTSGLCSYDTGERAFALGTNTLSSTVLAGSLSLVNQSPSATTTSPVIDTADYQMTVMAQSGGGLVSTPFTASITTSTDNPDWGVVQTGNPAANEAAWMYYNITGWDASTQTMANFGQWWAQMYGDSDSVNTLDSQCLNGASFHANAIWTVPQNPHNQGPLSVQLGYQNTLLLEGFVNCDNSGNGHHQIGAISYWQTNSLPTWDLVAMTGSQPDATVA